MRDHTARAFDDDLESLSRMLAEMARCAEKQVGEAAAALANDDRREAARVIFGHTAIDGLGQEIGSRAILTIARRQPMAVDLREIVGALVTCRDLEQIGEHAKGMAARAAAARHNGYPRALLDSLAKLTDLVLEQLVKVDDAYVARDGSSALAVIRGDADIDEAAGELLREAQLYMQQAPQNVETGSGLMFCATSLEQIGNLAAHMAATAFYIVEGRTLGKAG